MSPLVVLAWKLGASEPMRSRGCSPRGVARKRRKIGDACRAAKVEWVVERREVEARRAVRVSVAAMVGYLCREWKDGRKRNVQSQPNGVANILSTALALRHLQGTFLIDTTRRDWKATTKRSSDIVQSLMRYRSTELNRQVVF